MTSSELTVRVKATFANGSYYEGECKGSIEKIAAYFERLNKSFVLLNDVPVVDPLP